MAGCLNCFPLLHLPDNEVPILKATITCTYQTTLIGPKSPAFILNAGSHHIYANPKAMEGYKTGIFPGCFNCHAKMSDHVFSELRK